jgi:hypothetical protein
MRLLKSGDMPEETIHKTVMDWVRLNDSIKDLVIHIPNEGRRSERYGRVLKDMGMRAGVSDLLILMQRHGYGAAFIELKSKKGIVSKEQKKFLEDMELQNYFTCVCRSIESCIDTIKWYCFG